MRAPLVAALALSLLAGVAAFVYAEGLLEPVAAAPSVRVVDIAPGSSLGAVASRLESEGLIRSARAAKLWARLQGIESRLQVGEYELSPHQSTREILSALTSGRVKTYPITLPEGLRASEIAARLEEAGLVDAEAFLERVFDPDFAHALGVEADSLEGFLYPDTYQLARHLEPGEIAKMMVRQFEQVWERDIAPLAVDHRLSRLEIVTLASIVEKETGAPEERPLIAAVFLNRLARKMRLETDPTVIYGIPDFDGNLKKMHLLDTKNPYNTYRISGLPPGPIASPGVSALLAVMKPADTAYLYFVSKNDGTHYFSETYREHVNAVNRFQKNRRNRQKAIAEARKRAAAPGADASDGEPRLRADR